jgi:hypothetical protein
MAEKNIRPTSSSKNLLLLYLLYEMVDNWRVTSLPEALQDSVHRCLLL